MRAISRRLQVLVTATAVTAASLSLAVATGSSAQAAVAACNTTSLRYTGNYEYVRVPARSGSGVSCNLKLGTGSTSAVKALQDTIVTCYSSSAAARLIQNSGGIDGSYGAGTVKAVKSLQKYQLHFTGSNVDGVFGPKTRSAMMWQVRGDKGAPFYPWMCKNPTQV
ncbi:peptidoglycan-binding domain-containing protein [Streptomyces sp. NPDC048332]|uniref:peptidoglycan-binding domain-containing protein n=1 Tax=unclassified Streptomyces TaxID=2593676 RepID=UPI00343B8DE1